MLTTKADHNGTRREPIPADALVAQTRVAWEIAGEKGILRDTSTAITHTDFAPRVAAAWRELCLPEQRRRSRSRAWTAPRA